MLTFEQIKELIEQVADRGLGGLEIERSGFRLKIEGRAGSQGNGAAPTPEASSPAPRASESPPSSQADTSAASDDGEPDETPPPAGSHVLSSPIVGTVYHRPSPDADPFVQVGDRVRKGQVLCIVEAMKVMNEIESDTDGEVLEVYPKDAQPVEYGEPLFALRPD